MRKLSDITIRTGRSYELLKKFLIPSVLVFVLVGLTLTSYDGHAMSEYEKVTQQIKQVQQEAARRAREQREAEQRLARLQQQRQETIKDLKRIEEQLETNSLAMMELELQILDTENALMDANEQLAAVNKRIEERDELIRQRLRMMYKKGEVKYIEVLLDSTSFSDFIDRMHFLNMIVNQDQVILEQQKADKVVKEEKQREVESHLMALNTMYEEHEMKRLELEELRHQREVQIASIKSEEEHLEHITEEIERMVMELAAKEAALNEKRKKLAFSAGKLAFPLPENTYRLTSKFGPRVHPVTGERGKMHTGMDFGAPRGTSVYAAASGYVIAAQFVSGYGNYVIIDHGSGIWTLYAHMSKITTKKGAEVEVGEKIGEVGSTGTSTGNHLHFEVRKDGKAVDPATYLN